MSEFERHLKERTFPAKDERAVQLALREIDRLRAVNAKLVEVCENAHRRLSDASVSKPGPEWERRCNNLWKSIPELRVALAEAKENMP